MRTYERTHPWLSFELDLRRFTPEVWLLLGEARSKCEHLAGVPLRPDTARRLHLMYLAKGVLATTAIEGMKMAHAVNPNVILLKVVMPGMVADSSDMSG